MASEIIGFVGFVVAIAMALIGSFYWRKAQNLQAVLIEAANRFEAGRKAHQGLEAELKNVETRFQGARQTITKLDKQLDEARSRVAQHGKVVDNLEAGHKDQLGRFQLRTEHLGLEATALTEQLRESDAARKTLSNKVEDLTRDLARKQGHSDELAQVTQDLAKVREEWAGAKDRLGSSEREKKSLESDLAKAKALLQTVDPQEIRKLRQRLTKMEQIYNSMKGLREMAEERAENWEVALCALARHILGGASALDLDKRPLGVMVGQALEHIGATLVIDEEEAPAKVPVDQPLVSEVGGDAAHS